LSRQRRFNSVHAADQSSDYARIVGEIGAPLAAALTGPKAVHTRLSGAVIASRALTHGNRRYVK